jgi:hypothetical protein
LFQQIVGYPFAAMTLAARVDLASNHEDAEKRRAAVMRWSLALFVVAAFGAWAIGPYMRAELRRLEPWKVAAIFSGDAIALLWFIRFSITHLVLGWPLEDRPAAVGARWALAAFLISMVGGLALDSAFTIYLNYQDAVRYEVATKTTAGVSGMTMNHGPKGRNWTLLCEWRDEATQRTFHAPLRIHASVSHNVPTMPPELSGEIAEVLKRNEIPPTAQVRYDPQWPARAWIEGVPNDENGLFFVSLFVLFVQLVAVVLAAVGAWASVFGGAGVVPWWLDLSKAMTTAAEVAVLAFVGAVFRTFGV